MEKITMNVKEVAELLDVCDRTIYRLTEKNEIPHKKVGRRIIFHRGTIEQWLATPTV